MEILSPLLVSSTSLQMRLLKYIQPGIDIEFYGKLNCPMNLNIKSGIGEC